jgi:hypothetical protein
MANLDQVEIARPDFLALERGLLPWDRAEAFRAEGMPIVAWTVRTAKEVERLRTHVDNVIFEGFEA